MTGTPTSTRSATRWSAGPRTWLASSPRRSRVASCGFAQERHDMVEREILSGVNSIDGNAVIQSLSERPGDPRFNYLPDLIDAVRKGIMENTTYGSAGGDSTVIVLAFVANLLEIDRNLDPRASRHRKKAVEALRVARLALGCKAKGEAACIALSRAESQILAVSDKLRRYL